MGHTVHIKLNGATGGDLPELRLARSHEEAFYELFAKKFPEEVPSNKGFKVSISAMLHVIMALTVQLIKESSEDHPDYYNGKATAGMLNFLAESLFWADNNDEIEIYPWY